MRLRISKGALIGAVIFGLAAIGYALGSLGFCQSQFGCSVETEDLVIFVLIVMAVGTVVGWGVGRGVSALYRMMRVD